MSELTRYSRQATLVPPDKFANANVVLVGVGAVGRRLALLLADMGCGSITLVDHDSVEIPNFAPQGYREEHLGKPKAEATAADCRTQNPTVRVTPIPRRFGKSDWRMLENTHVFSCVDSITARGILYEAAVKAGSPWFGDARVAGDTIRVIAAPGPLKDDGPYAGTLFAQSEAYAGVCNAARMSSYSAAASAALLACKFAQFVRGSNQAFSDHNVSLSTWDIFCG
jgi:sulfur carrier protein ThiS adenylyltransferase